MITLRSKNRSVTLVNRGLAKAIDLLIIFFASVVLPHPLGVFVGLIYILMNDGLSGGRSIGKKLLGFRVVTYDGSDEGGRGAQKPCNFLNSTIRNAPLGVATFFAIIPFWGWILSIAIGVPMIAIEIYLMATRPFGARLGDVMADSRVVEVQSSNEKGMK